MDMNCVLSYVVWFKVFVCDGVCVDVNAAYSDFPLRTVLLVNGQLFQVIQYLEPVDHPGNETTILSIL